ncbi:hypothetical protein PsYK624_126310 [Phanerochaete sordida]|uniref:Uncharacterized protein n=1 Tax=Phanerochaete sordida TaxID=48140 RepID=A0A9P3GLH4_9APHY|nr:hypothetical protein PsYK624_126310 [Phanerochaete sordida]
MSGSVSYNPSPSTMPPQAIPPPPPGLNYIAAIRPVLTIIIIATIFVGVFITLLATLFLLSTRDLRRQPIFVLNVLILFLGVALCSLTSWLDINAILRPLDANNAQLPASALVSIAPIVVESVLFVRIFAVYPWSKISTRMKLLAYGFPVALRTARAINIVFGLIEAAGIYRNNQGLGISVAQRAWHTNLTKVECFLQLVDNTYMSVLFLWKLRQATKLSDNIRIRSSSSYTKRVRTLTWIVSSNFVIPDFLSLIQLIGLFLPQTTNVEVYIVGIFFTNPCIEIISVLFATVWAASNHWRADSDAPPPSFSISLGSRSTECSSFPDRRHSRIVRSPTVTPNGVNIPLESSPAMDSGKMRFEQSYGV